MGHPGRAPRKKKVGLELGNNAPVIIEPDADHEHRGPEDLGGGVQPRRPVVHLDPARLRARVDRGRVPATSSCPQVEALKVGDPLDEATDVSTLISTGERDRVASWIDEAKAGGADVLTGGEVDGPFLRPTVLANVKPDMKVCALEVFGPVVAVQTLHRRRRSAARSPTTPGTGCRPRSSPRDLGTALRAARTLEYGGVLVNEVPTFRADQMPYGGVRDSGNTREGPQ